MNDQATENEQKAPLDSAAEAKAKSARYNRSARLVWVATAFVLVGLFDSVHAKVFCLDNLSVTTLRIFVYFFAVATVLTAIGLVIESKRLRIYYAIIAILFGLWVTGLPYYYSALRADVSMVECMWKTGSTGIKR